MKYRILVSFKGQKHEFYEGTIVSLDESDAEVAIRYSWAEIIESREKKIIEPKETKRQTLKLNRKE